MKQKSTKLLIALSATSIATIISTLIILCFHPYYYPTYPIFSNAKSGLSWDVNWDLNSKSMMGVLFPFRGKGDSDFSVDVGMEFEIIEGLGFGKAILSHKNGTIKPITFINTTSTSSFTSLTSLVSNQNPDKQSTNSDSESNSDSDSSYANSYYKTVYTLSSLLSQLKNASEVELGFNIDEVGVVVVMDVEGLEGEVNGEEEIEEGGKIEELIQEIVRSAGTLVRLKVRGVKVVGSNKEMKQEKMNRKGKEQVKMSEWMKNENKKIEKVKSSNERFKNAKAAPTLAKHRGRWDYDNNKKEDDEEITFSKDEVIEL